MGPRNRVSDGGADPEGKGQFSGVVRAILKHWQSSLHCKKDHSIANNVMQQKGSFSMPGKHK